MRSSWLARARRAALAAAVAAVAALALVMHSTPARADDYTSFLVTQLKHDPVYISSYSSQATPSDAAAVSKLLAKVPLKAYVVVDSGAGPDGQLEADDFTAILHDQLGGGLYILDRDGDVSATGFGTSLPVGDAMRAATYELNGDPTLIQLITRFQQILASGKTEQRVAADGAKIDAESGPPPGLPGWEIPAALVISAALGCAGTVALTLRRRRKRRLPLAPAYRLPAVVAVAGALALAGHATGSGSPAAAAPSGIPAVVAGLRASPLYVDPEMDWMFTPSSRASLQAALKSSPVPVFIVAVPLSIDEDEDDYQNYFLDQLYHARGVNGAYLLVGPSGRIFDAEYNLPRDVLLSQDTEFGSDSMVEPAQIAASTPGRLASLVHQVDAAPPGNSGLPDPVYSAGEFPGGRPAPDLPAVLPPDNAGGPSQAPVIASGIGGLLVVGPLLALAGFGATRRGRRIAARRRGWGDAGDPGSPLEKMPAAPSASWLRHHASGELAELARMISAGGDDNPGWARATDDYDAAALAAGQQATPIDLAGAIVLARDGRMALALRDPSPPPPCQVNPLHGRASRAISRQLAWPEKAPAAHSRKEAQAPVPVCDQCARQAAGNSPAQSRQVQAAIDDRVLRVADHGSLKRYYEFASVWRDRQFGAAGEGLPQAVREHLGVE